MKKIMLLIVLLFVFIINVQGNEKEKVTLIKCVDGDTAIFDINGENARVRFLGIDTPESVKEENVIEPYGKEASEFTCDKLNKAREIILEYDSNSDKQDKYGRTLAWVFVDNVLLEEELVKIGYAKVKYIYGDYAYINELNELQNYAKENKLGIWSDYVPVYYKVTFYDNDKSVIKEVLENKQVDYFEPKKDGYKFVGWFIDNEKFDFNTKINKDTILTARYEKDINIIEILLISIVLLTIYLIFNRKGK